MTGSEGAPVRRVWLFVSTCALGGFGGAAGSILGHALGPRGLYAGGVVGGLVGVAVAARLGVWRRWITRAQLAPTALGGAVGFLAAALIAVNTLSSPVGPALSTVLVGTGALLGARARAGTARDGAV